MDFQGPPPGPRLEEISDALVKAATDPSSQPPKFRKVWGNRESATPVQHQLEDRIRIDNRTSDSHTIINVFAYDRLGLLYSIASTLFEAGLSVDFAKIGTHLDQVVDVFYVQNADGEKLSDPNEISLLKQTLQDALPKREPQGS